MCVQANGNVYLTFAPQSARPSGASGFIGSVSTVCKTGENEIDWLPVGTVGSGGAGATGATGPNGPQGATGPAGSAASTGVALRTLAAGGTGVALRVVCGATPA
jgi:hypothetical protein